MWAASLLTLPLVLGTPQGAGTDAATPIAHFVHHGNDRAVTRGDVALEMAFHLRRKDDGRRACKQLVTSALVRRAADQQGLWPDPEQVQERWREVRRQLQAAGRDLDREPLLRNCSEETLLDYLAVDMAHERIVRQELGLRADEQVSPAMLELWVQEARQRTEVVEDPDALPIGVAVRVGTRDVPLLDLGMLLLRSSDQDEIDKFVRQFVLVESLEARARELDITIDDQDLETELELRRQQANSDPRYRGLSFEQLLDAEGLSTEWLLSSRVFRAHVLQKKIVQRLHPRSQLLELATAQPDTVRDRYGPRRHLAIVFARALDEPNALVPRDHDTAMTDLARARERLDKESFANVARIESDDPATKSRGGDCGFLARGSRSLPAPVMTAAWQLEPGEVSAPVRADDGCYLVKVIAVEPPLDDDTLVARMREHRIESLTYELLQQATITRDDGSPVPIGRNPDAEQPGADDPDRAR